MLTEGGHFAGIAQPINSPRFTKSEESKGDVRSDMQLHATAAARLVYSSCDLTGSGQRKSFKIDKTSWYY